MGHPCWIYHDTEGPQLIDSDQRGEYFKAGWRDHPNNAVQQEGAVPVEEDNPLSEKDHLLSQAAELGVKVDKRWNMATLRKRVKDAQEDDG